jgi:hypothetical protein
MGLRQIEMVFGKINSNVINHRSTESVVTDLIADCGCSFHKGGTTYHLEKACSPEHQSLYLGVNKVAHEKAALSWES